MSSKKNPIFLFTVFVPLITVVMKAAVPISPARATAPSLAPDPAG